MGDPFFRIAEFRTGMNPVAECNETIASGIESLSGTCFCVHKSLLLLCCAMIDHTRPNGLGGVYTRQPPGCQGLPQIPSAVVGRTPFLQDFLRGRRVELRKGSQPLCTVVVV